jgi:hypothetical protein
MVLDRYKYASNPPKVRFRLTFLCLFYPPIKFHNTPKCHIPVRSYFSPFPSSGTDGHTGATAGMGQVRSVRRLSRRFRCEGRCRRAAAPTRKRAHGWRSDTRRGVRVGGIEQPHKRPPSPSAESVIAGSTSVSCAAPEHRRSRFSTVSRIAHAAILAPLPLAHQLPPASTVEPLPAHSF